MTLLRRKKLTLSTPNKLLTNYPYFRNCLDVTTGRMQDASRHFINVWTSAIGYLDTLLLEHARGTGIYRTRLRIVFDQPVESVQVISLNPLRILTKASIANPISVAVFGWPDITPLPTIIQVAGGVSTACMREYPLVQTKEGSTTPSGYSFFTALPLAKTYEIEHANVVIPFTTSAFDYVQIGPCMVEYSYAFRGRSHRARQLVLPGSAMESAIRNVLAGSADSIVVPCAEVCAGQIILNTFGSKEA